jgi:dynein light intermediate chain, axonemal
MAIAAYETLYESSIAYGIRKALMAEQKRTELNAKLKKLAENNQTTRSNIDQLKRSIELTQQRAVEKRETEEASHREEVERIQKTNDQLKTTLESMLSAPKK